MVPGTSLYENVPWETIKLFYLKPFQKDWVDFIIIIISILWCMPRLPFVSRKLNSRNLVSTLSRVWQHLEKLVKKKYFPQHFRSTQKFAITHGKCFPFLHKRKTLSLISHLSFPHLLICSSPIVSFPHLSVTHNPLPHISQTSTAPSRLLPPLASLSVPHPLQTKPSRLSTPSPKQHSQERKPRERVW